MNYTNLTYKGVVNLKLKINDKLYTIENFNAGLPWLQYAFCKLIIGDPIDDTLYPHYLDLRKSEDNGATWQTFLQSPIPLSGKVINHDVVN